MVKLVDNKQGLGLVALFHQSILDEQISWVKGQEIKLESKTLSDLAPRTKQEEQDLSWDESLML